MKKLFYFSIVACIAFLVACSGGPAKKIIGTWKCENIEIENLDEAIDKMVAQMPDSLKESTKVQMKEQMKANMDQMKGALTMTFKEDKSFESAMQGKTDKGTWEISEDGKMLSAKMEGKQGEDKFNIVEFTDAKFVISMEQEGTKTKMTFVK